VTPDPRSAPFVEGARWQREQTPAPTVPEACDGGANPSLNHEGHRWPCGDATSAPTDEDREALIVAAIAPALDRAREQSVPDLTSRECMLVGHGAQAAAEFVLAAGFRRQPTVTAEQIARAIADWANDGRHIPANLVTIDGGPSVEARELAEQVAALGIPVEESCGGILREALAQANERADAAAREAAALRAVVRAEVDGWKPPDTVHGGALLALLADPTPEADR
jgi:hypothetical protein